MSTSIGGVVKIASKADIASSKSNIQEMSNITHYALLRHTHNHFFFFYLAVGKQLFGASTPPSGREGGSHTHNGSHIEIIIEILLIGLMLVWALIYRIVSLGIMARKK